MFPISRASRQGRMAGVQALILNTSAFSARLKRLRKNFEQITKSTRELPQGLKAALIMWRLRHD
jgi:hypothetical protein